MTIQELGWLVVITSMAVAVSLCIGVCLSLYCRNSTGKRNKISPATILDPTIERNGSAPSRASLLLPTVTKSEFGSEPRTPSSSVSHLSQSSKSYWSVGQNSPQGFLPMYQSPVSPTEFEDAYVPYSSSFSSHPAYPHKYATTHYTRFNQGGDGRFTVWDSSPSEMLPMVPTSQHTFRPQPKHEVCNSSVNSISKMHNGRTRSQLHQGLVVGRDVKSAKKIVPDESTPLAVKRKGNRYHTQRFSDSESVNLSSGNASDNDFTKEAYEYKSGTIKRRRRKNKRIENSVASSFEKEALEAVSKRLQELSLLNQDSSPSSAMPKTHLSVISLSTGLKLDQIPSISSGIGSSPSRESSRNRTPKKGPLSPMNEDVINHLGIESGLSPTRSDSKSTEGDENVDKTTQSSDMSNQNVKQGQNTSLASVEPTSGFLGSLEIQLKYQSAHEQLIVRILSVRNVPARYMSSGTKLYVKILIDGSSKYTTPLVTAEEPVTFQNTIAHPISSSKLAATIIRFSLCQYDTRHRRLVIGYVNLHPMGLWPILYLNTTLSHNLTTQSLLLNLSDSTPDHQIDCNASVTFGLLLSEDHQDVTITSVTLQRVSGKEIAENAPVYMKVSLYQGSELITWKRSKPTLLNRQRTHLVHRMELQQKSNADTVCGGNESDSFLDRDESKTVKFVAKELSGTIDDNYNEEAEEITVSMEKTLLVLSVRLKTMKRGGRCVLGSVFIGEDAPTEEGRLHWSRALKQASVGVPAAGSHTLTHN